MLSAQKYGKNLPVNYSPFGAILYGRNWSSEKYRYGFNGMEKDDEVKGSGNEYTTEYRQYDSRLGRWTSVDREFTAWESTFASFMNNPICYNDVFGDKVRGSSAGMKSFKAYEAQLKITSAKILQQMNKDRIDNNGANLAVLTTLLNNVSQQQANLQKLKKSKVIFYVDVKKERTGIDTRRPSDISGNRVKKTRKGRVDILLFKGEENEGMAFGGEIGNIFLEGGWSFTTTLKNNTLEDGSLSDKGDLRAALQRSALWQIDIGSETLVDDLNQKDMEIEQNVQQSGLPSENRTLKSFVPKQHYMGLNFEGDKDKESVSLSNESTFLDSFKSGGTAKDIYFDPSTKTFINNSLKGERGEFGSKNYKRATIKDGQIR